MCLMAKITSVLNVYLFFTKQYLNVVYVLLLKNKEILIVKHE